MSLPLGGCEAEFALITVEALIEFQGDSGASHDQSRDEGAKESFAPAPGVVHELEEPQVQRQGQAVLAESSNNAGEASPPWHSTSGRGSG